MSLTDKVDMTVVYERDCKMWFFQAAGVANCEAIQLDRDEMRELEQIIRLELDQTPSLTHQIESMLDVIKRPSFAKTMCLENALIALKEEAKRK